MSPVQKDFDTYLTRGIVAVQFNFKLLSGNSDVEHHFEFLDVGRGRLVRVTVGCSGRLSMRTIPITSRLA